MSRVFVRIELSSMSQCTKLLNEHSVNDVVGRGTLILGRSNFHAALVMIFGVSALVALAVSVAFFFEFPAMLPAIHFLPRPSPTPIPVTMTKVVVYAVDPDDNLLRDWG